MISTATSVEAYLKEVSEDKKETIIQLRNCVLQNIPKGFKEQMIYGSIGYVVPHSLFPAGYHCDPKLPLPFINIAAQKNFIAIYHMGIYVNQKLLNWFLEEYSNVSKKKLDMGKSCMRFKKSEDIPFQLIEQLVRKISVQDWISLYQNSFHK